ncbi:MAG: hypothetical protein JW821_03305 [Deltaproteobacteria bacterium]|nr:hypothetical protein [Deltaproteobacteria bacterium]
MYDLIILGGGPAGLTAGFYCSRALLKVLPLEELAPGGRVPTTPYAVERHLETLEGR